MSYRFEVGYQAQYDEAAYSPSPGDVVVCNALGKYELATSAARTLYGRPCGIVGELGRNQGFILVSGGPVETSITGLDASTASAVRVSSAGRLERVASPSASDDVVGACDASGLLHLAGVGLPYAPPGAPAGGTTGQLAVNVSPGLLGWATMLGDAIATYAASVLTVVVQLLTGTADPLRAGYTYLQIAGVLNRITSIPAAGTPAFESIRKYAQFFSAQTNTLVYERSVGQETSPTFSIQFEARDATGGGTTVRRYDAAYTVERATGAATLTTCGTVLATGSLAGTSLTVDVYDAGAGDWRFRVRFSSAAACRYSLFVDRSGA